MADEVGRKFVQGPSNPFLEGNQGKVQANLQNLPGMTSRTAVLPTAASFAALQSRGRGDDAQKLGGATPEQIDADKQDAADAFGSYDSQKERYTIIAGTPKTVIPKIRHVLETLRPGSIFFWDGDGAMTHDDSMRSLKLMGEEVLPAIREIGEELDLRSPFEIDPATNKAILEAPAAGGD